MYSELNLKEIMQRTETSGTECLNKFKEKN